jgi:hypothetical protein
MTYVSMTFLYAHSIESRTFSILSILIDGLLCASLSLSDTGSLSDAGDE